MNKIERTLAILAVSLFLGVFIEGILSVYDKVFDYKNFMFIFITLVIILCFAYEIIYKLILHNARRYKAFDIKYVRDDLKKLTPSYVYYVLNLDLDVDKCVDATLLKLVHDKYLIIVNNHFELTDKSLNDLKGSERFLIKCLKNKRNTLSYKPQYDFENQFFKEAYKQLVIKELLDLNYVSYRRISGKILSIISIMMIVSVFAIVFVLSFALDRKTFNDIGPVAMLALMIVVVLSSIIGMSVSKAEGADNYKRTSKGKEFLYEIVGLKKFLQDFTNIENTKIEELELREFYFIYSIIFDLNNDEKQKIKKLKLDSIK
ncbi:MAG: DUF2207 domain-containing protein [Bacilli bacterium]|nr:DUF2207 domain-containing protein [Bacilli bacterium]